MDEKEPISLTARLPRDLLPQLTDLVKAVQGLAAQLGAAPADRRTEEGVNTRFDPQRFREMAEPDPVQPPEGGTVQVPVPVGTEEAPPVEEAPPREPVLAAPEEVPPREIPAFREETVPPREADPTEPAPEEAPASVPAAIPGEAPVEGGSRWRSGAAQELSYAGPAPLTAEAVSLAFRQDDRRYDSGFPLY